MLEQETENSKVRKQMYLFARKSIPLQSILSMDAARLRFLENQQQQRSCQFRCRYEKKCAPLKTIYTTAPRKKFMKIYQKTNLQIEQIYEHQNIFKKKTQPA